jgi:DNA-binding LacI/PurR family transcriptional regulator
MGRPNALFVDLVQQLRQQLLASFTAGEGIPSTRAIAATYGVGAMTALRALRYLSREKIIHVDARRRWVRAPAHTPRRAKHLRVGIISPYTREHWDKTPFYGLLREEAGRRRISITESPHTRAHPITPARSRIDLTRVPWARFDVGLIVDVEDAVTLAGIRRLGRAVLSVDRDGTVFGIDSATYDNGGAGRLAAQHLLSLGHRRFAITDEVSDPGWPNEQTWLARRHGFEAAIGHAGGCIRPEWRLAIPHRGLQAYRFGALRAAIAAWKNQPAQKRPTALFCFDDSLTDDLVAEFRRHGFLVPQHLSVVTISGSMPRPSKSQLYTAVWLDAAALARRTLDAAQEIAARKKASQPQPQLFTSPALLIEGNSTTAPVG